MDPMIVGFVRDRTDDLQRVAAGIRRERDLRSTLDEGPVDVPAPTPFPTGVTTAAMPCDETPTVPTARRAA
jgi:hypothetical protein